MENGEDTRERGKVEGGRGGFRVDFMGAGIKLASMKLKVLVHAAEEGGFWAEVPALPGCVSQGETLEEVRVNIREAIEGWLLVEDDAAAITSEDQVIEIAV
jgi:predicted RNase H-like HicB family nuclease